MFVYTHHMSHCSWQKLIYLLSLACAQKQTRQLGLSVSCEKHVSAQCQPSVDVNCSALRFVAFVCKPVGFREVFIVQFSYKNPSSSNLICCFHYDDIYNVCAMRCVTAPVRNEHNNSWWEALTLWLYWCKTRILAISSWIIFLWIKLKINLVTDWQWVLIIQYQTTGCAVDKYIKSVTYSHCGLK